MKAHYRKSLMLMTSLSLLLALGACDRNDNSTVGQTLDSALKKTEQVASKAKEEAQDAAARAGAAAKRVGEDAKTMGAGAGDKVDDASITFKVNAQLAADKDLSAAKIDVDTKNGVVTLTGPAPSTSARERATEIARNVKGVSSVKNQLTVKAG
jgi:hyperosmotically inducible protein